MKKFWTIYCVTNTVNGKQYIGLTKNLSIRRSAHLKATGKQSSKVLRSALNKYGAEAFEFAPVASCLSRADACFVERLLIKDRMAKVPNGYNLTDGGEGAGGYKQTPESIGKRVLKLRGKKRPPEATAKTAAAQRGRKFSAETLRKMSLAKLGKKVTNPNVLVALANGRVNSRTQEAQDKRTKAQTGVPRPYASALCSKTMSGRKWPTEVIAKRAAAIGEAKRHKKLLMFMEYAGMY